MTDRAAIQASLVDMRNVGAHKSLKITLHVPEEYALKAIEAFGWPSGAHPVPVALARIHVEAREVASQKPPPSSTRNAQAGARDTRLARQAALLCKHELFHRYLEDILKRETVDEEFATHYLRNWCDVESRSQITPRSVAGQLFGDLLDEFYRWRDVPKFVNA